MDKAFDLLLQGVNLFDGASDIDVAIQNGKIAAVEGNIPPQAAAEVLDFRGKLLIPGFVDSHTHLDKALTIRDEEADGLVDAVNLFRKYQNRIPKEKIAEDVKRRAARVLDMEIAHGSTCVKTHVLCDEVWGMESVYALDELRHEYAGRITLQLIVPWSEANAEELDRACRKGIVDYFAGYAHLCDDFRAELDGIFARGEKYGIPLDLHVNESDVGNIDEFLYIQQKTLELHMKGLVNCSHVTAMCAVDDETAKRGIELAARAGTNIITLPSCNMYLMGRHDRQPVRRGVTRVREFLQAGVNVAYASDNIRDPFRPFGNSDMLEEGLFTAQVLQCGTASKLAEILRMGTFRAARNAHLSGYGLTAGCTADLAVLDAETPHEAIVTRAQRLLVLKKGRVVSRNGVLTP